MDLKAPLALLEKPVPLVLTVCPEILAVLESREETAIPVGPNHSGL